MKKFSDFAKNEYNLEGDKITIDEIFDKNITVLAFRVLRSKYEAGRECAQVQFDLEGVKKVIFTASEVLISQLKEYAEELPFEATVQKEGRYYTFK